MSRHADYFWKRSDLANGAVFLRVAWLLFAAGIVTLGVLNFAAADFAFQWQPVAADVPGRASLARIVGVLFVITGTALLVPTTTRIAAAALTLAFWVWELLLHLPALLATGANWLGAAELLALCGGSLALFGMTAEHPHTGMRAWLTGRSAIDLGKFMFALSLPIFGWSHFIYAEPASQLIPSWVPGRLFFTYLTGIGHIAAGLSLLTGVLARLAAPMLCAMFGCFIVFLHIPRTLAAPASRYEWTTTVMSILLSGAAWAIAGAVRVAQAKRSPATLFADSPGARG
jgi:uncharacterized membrane protein